MKKYELILEDNIDFFGIKLFRILAISSFGNVKKGDEGGYIASEKNLSQEGDAWVSGNARVCGNAQVYGNAHVYGDALVYGNARVYGNAWEHSPLYAQGSKHAVTNCAFGKIAIGCEVHTFSEWQAQAEEIGKRNGYSGAEIAEYKAIIDFMVRLGK